MSQFNLLGSTPKVVRDVAARRANKEENRRLALRFGEEYFDGTREQGYGGYRYDGRWVAVAQRLVDEWGLAPGSRVLDVGCAKGFLVHDLLELVPGLEVWGIDVSRYALARVHGRAAGRVALASCEHLPFRDGYFQAALAINTVHNLEPGGCETAIREIERVAPGGGFIQVDAYRNETERAVFEDWMLTARTYLMPDEWEELFRKCGYTGRYWWTVLEVDEWAITDRR